MTRPAPAALAAAVVLGLALVLGGCDSILPQSSSSTAVPGPNAVRQLMLEQLRDKYGEDFECVDLGYAAWPFEITSYTMSARRAGDPDRGATFTARWDPRPLHDGPITDDYLDVKMAHLFTAAAQDHVDVIFPLNTTQIRLSGDRLDDYPLPDVSEADYRVWAAENAGVGMDVIIPAEPDVPRDDIAALLPGVIGSTSELGLSDSGITVTAYSPDNYYELARLHAENKYVFDNNYGLDAEFRVTYYWTS